MWVAYHTHRTIMTLQGLCLLTIVVRRCRNQTCSRYQQACRPEEEGRWALPHGECGLDLIAQVGTLRYREHRSISEIHQHLQERQIQICERTVEHILHRYDELVSVHIHQRDRLYALMHKQGRAILALDGLQPDVGHEVLWVIREVLSGEILLARALLSSSQEDLAALLTEVKEALPIPVTGLISDGQLSIRKAVAAVFPDKPHQLCHFHYLREAAKPIYEADRHAKKELKKQVRSIRPIERSLEGQTDEEAQVMRDYCLAVRSALTDDGRPPLEASGLKLHDRLSQISTSIDRVAEKRGLPKPLERLQTILKKGLQATGTDWEMLGQVYGWVHQIAEVFDETHTLRCEERQVRFGLILLHMQEHADQLRSSWKQAVACFLKVTQSYGPHLFFCYQIPDLPQTNNDLEQAFGQVRFHERRATGRRGALPGLVVHGAIRVQAALATRLRPFTAHELAPYDIQAWRTLRAEVSFRQEGRRKQWRFRKDPPAYLAALEAQLLKNSLRS